MSKFPQRITALVTLDVHTEGLDWARATALVHDALNGNSGNSGIYLKKVISLESLDEEVQP